MDFTQNSSQLSPTQQPQQINQDNSNLKKQQAASMEQGTVSARNQTPCNCSLPGPHETDCMWNVWQNMRDNYEQTKAIMAKFVNHIDSIELNKKEVQCDCQSRNNRKGTEMSGLFQSIGGATLFQGDQFSPNATLSLLERIGANNRRMVKEQERIVNTWVQFFNIFDMALDLANDVSEDRKEAEKRKRERMRIEKEELLEEKLREKRELRKRSSISMEDDKHNTGNGKSKKKDIKKESKPKINRESQDTLKSESKLNINRESQDALKSESKPNINRESQHTLKSESKPNINRESQDALKSESKPNINRKSQHTLKSIPSIKEEKTGSKSYGFNKSSDGIEVEEEHSEDPNEPAETKFAKSEDSNDDFAIKEDVKP